MPINKVSYAGNTLIDLTEDTVDAENLAKGLTAHTADGNAIVGLAPKTWTGTKDEYELAKDTIPVGTIVNITDDYSGGGEGGNADIYSEEEIVIGTFLDKPLYRKMILYNKSVSASDTNTGIVIQDARNIISCKWMRLKQLNSENGGVCYCSAWYMDTLYIHSYVGHGIGSGQTTYLVVEYTKTTD